MSDKGQASPDKQKPLNCDPDAARWAREFMEVWNKNPVMDEGWMLSWFANAIMCGVDTERWKMEREAPSAVTDTTRALAERCRPAVAHDAKLRDRDTRSDKYAFSYRPVLEAEAQQAQKLLDDIDAILATPPSPGTARRFEFDRIRGGVVMAEGIAVNATSLAEATIKAHTLLERMDTIRPREATSSTVTASEPAAYVVDPTDADFGDMRVGFIKVEPGVTLPYGAPLYAGVPSAREDT